MFLPGSAEHLGFLPGSEECALRITSKSGTQDVFVWNHSDYFIKSLFMLNISVAITNRVLFLQRTKPRHLAISGTLEQLKAFNYLNASYNPLSVAALLDGTPDEGEKLIFLFWSLKIYNVIVVLEGMLLRSVHIGCGNYRIIKLNRCAFFSEHDTRFGDCAFQINYVEREPFFIGHPDDGVDYLILKLILNRCGINDIVWLKEKNYGSLVNGTWTDALGNLADIAAGGFVVSVNRLNDFLLTYPHFLERYKWFTPVPALEQVWLGMDILDFGNHILMFIFMCCCFSIFSEGERMFSTPSLCFLNVLRVVLGQPIRKTPRKTPVRIIFISWAWYQMIFNSVMSGNLMESLYNRKKIEVPVRNVARISCLAQAANETTSIIPSEMCDITKLALSLANNRNFTILAAEQPMTFTTDKLNLPVRKVGKTFIRQLKTFILPKYSPYYDKINKLLSLTFETGLMHKTIHDVERRNIKPMIKKIPETSTNKALVFALFAGCYGVCTLVFLLEIALFKN